MKKRGVRCVIVLMIFLFSIVSVTAALPPPPKPLDLLKLEELEHSGLSEEEKIYERENITETFKEIRESEAYEKTIKEIESSQGVPVPGELETEEGEIEELIASRGQESNQDYTIDSVSIDASSDVANVRICNLGVSIEKIDENMLAISMMLQHEDGYVEIARWKPMIEFDETQCMDTKVSMKAIYYKYNLKRGQNMKLLVDADGKYKERNEDNNVIMYSLGAEKFIDGTYSVAGPVKESPLSPELSASQTAAIFDEDSCADIIIKGTSHNVCLMSDNFLRSKLTIDGFEDSIIHLWSWDWVNAMVNDIEVETSGEFFIFTQV